MGYESGFEIAIGSQYFSRLRLETVSQEVRRPVAQEVRIRPVKGDPDYIAPAGAVGSQYLSRPSLVETVSQEVRIRRPVRVIPTILPLQGQLAGL